MEANLIGVAQCAAQTIQIWLQTISRNANQAACESTGVRPPRRVVVPAVCQRWVAGKGLPKAPIRRVLPAGGPFASPGLQPAHNRDDLFNADDLDWRHTAGG